MALDKTDLVAILVRFGVDTTQKLLKVTKRNRPLDHNETYVVQIDGKTYRILMDDTTNIGEKYILDQFNDSQQGLEGSLMHNPENGELAAEYGGHAVYVFLNYIPVRLDATLAATYPEYSRSTWQKYCAAGHVYVNDVAKPAKYLLKFSDKISLQLPPPENHDEKSIPIIYQDADVVVINKPTGILTHAKGALNEEFTVADFARRHTTDDLESNRPGIVHRLDRATSGILILAKHQEAKTFLQKQFQDRKAKKTYLAVVHGIPKNTEAVIRLPIERNPLKPQTFRIGSSGKFAETSYKVLETFDKGAYSLIELKPLTGRTHQLRVHLAYLKCPIVGDNLYGKAKDTERLMLHAQSLEITTPARDRKTFDAPLPPDFVDWMKLHAQDPRTDA